MDGPPSRHGDWPMSVKSQPLVAVQQRRPRGRPKAEDLAALEARLITVGRQLFFQNGYGATTMSAVANAARVSKTTLYARFPSKPALFRSIATEQISVWNAGIYVTPSGHWRSLEEALLAFGDIILRAAMTVEFRQMSRLIYSEAERFPELAEIARARFKRGADYLSQVIAEFAERENTPCDDPRVPAEVFLFTLATWSHLAVLDDREVELGEYRTWLAKTVRIFLAGRSGW